MINTSYNAVIFRQMLYKHYPYKAGYKLRRNHCQ